MLVTLCQEEEDEDDDNENSEPEITIKLNDPLDLGEKEYGEDSLFPFKKTIDSNENIS